MDKSPVTPCPDAETLAAWLDHGLEDRERTSVTAHVATCDECRGIAANVLTFQDAERVQEAGPGAAPLPFLNAPAAAVSTAPPARVFRLGRKITWGGGVLAAAAALVLAVNLQPRLVDGWWTTSAEARLADLAQATTGQRTVEGRLTGGFEYGPLRAPVRSGGSTAAPKDNWALLAAAAKISEEAEKSPVAANLHGLGVAALVLGEHDEAISALEDATSEEPESGRYQSDLAAAYLARAQAADRPDDLTRGLTAAERALKANDNLLEARFNRALALERLYLTDQARKAWQEYLEYDPASPWSEEARQHLQALPEPAATEGQARNNSPPEVTDNTVEAALEWVLRIGLASWADAVLASDLPRAALQHAQLVRYAEAISEASGDPFAAAAVRSVQTDRGHAEAVRRFAQALRALSGDNYQTAEPDFTAACPRLHEPMRSLCFLELGAITALRDQGKSTASSLATATALADEKGYAYLAGAAHRLRGWHLLTAGQTAPSLPPYLASYEAFERGHYPVHSGLVADQIANLFDMQGLTQQASRWMLTSLRIAASAGDENLAFITRVSASGALRRRGIPEAALIFADAVGLPNPSMLPPLKRVNRERLRLGALLALGHPDAAESTVETMQKELARSSDFRAERMRPDVLLLQAQVALERGDDVVAATALDEAISSMGAIRVSQRISALLTRSRLSTRRARSGDAEADIREALQLLMERASSSSQALQLYDAQAALDSVSSVVLARADLQNSRGLLLLEQLREVLDSTPADRRIASVELLEERLAALGANQSVVYYLFSNDGSLLAWVLARDGQTFVKLPVAAAEVARLVNLLTVQVARAPGREAEWRHTLESLHQALLAGLPVLGDDLVVVPDGVLNRVPFGSLLDPRSGRFVFEARTVRLAPNLSLALVPNAAPPEPAKRALVIGEPALKGTAARVFERLPQAKAEAKAVARLYENATLLVGPDATREEVMRALPASDVIHFAGHALAATDGRDGAQLLLAGSVDDPMSALRVGDVAREGPQGPRSVVLAACGTAAASGDRSSGVASLAAAFLRAGSRSVVGTLWPVDDKGSEEFFVSLHRRLATGDNMATALSRAQQACRASATCKQSVATWLGTAAYGSS